MRIGLSLPHYDFSLPGPEPISFARMAEVATRAERLGFDSVWVSDHFVYSLARYGGPDGLHGSLEPMTALAALAPLTERVRLGTLVLCGAFRHPAILAKSATALDLLSGGRLDLGIGAGWYEDEFRRFGVAFGTVGDRFRALEETVGALDALLRGGPVDFEGRRVRLRGAFNHPVPAQRPRPPIWIGAKGGDRALRLVARHADGWNTVWRWTPEAYADRVRRARELCDLEGRDPRTLRLSLGLYTVVGEDRGDLRARYAAMQRWIPGVIDREPLEVFAADTLTGTPEQVIERLARFAELGVEEVVLAPAPLPFALPDPSMLELLASAVIPKARSL
ncbi:MAG TPA: LLM class flavin-dependent oxidoreductase [Actinomycetota bacterium]|jgi:probable F420-dependent oxidoreductase|nr:LLM class flavin-dependent oxidoreductase [Actinomycetota bacterium]